MSESVGDGARAMRVSSVATIVARTGLVALESAIMEDRRGVGFSIRKSEDLRASLFSEICDCAKITKSASAEPVPIYRWENPGEVISMQCTESVSEAKSQNP